MIPAVAFFILSQAPELLDGGSSADVLIPIDDAGVVSLVDAGVDEDPDKRMQTVVTGSRTERKLKDVVVPTEVITRTQIEQLGVRDLGQLLQQHPGVEMAVASMGSPVAIRAATRSGTRKSIS